MPHTHQHHHNIFHYFLNRELSEIYLTVAGKTFAISLIGIFVPIYLFQMGFELRYIFLFFAILSAVFALTVFFAAKLSTKIGIKHGLLISMPFLIAFYILLQSITTNALNWLFFLAPVLAGIHNSFFWLNFHTDFARFSSRRFRAEQISGYAIVCALLSALGPVIGGIILLYFGFNVLFILVSLLLLLSTIPLFLSKEVYIPKDFSFRKVGETMKKASFVGISGFIGHGLFACAGLAWIILIYFILKAYLEMGVLTSLSIFIGIFSTFFVGKLADKFGNGPILRIGSLFNALGWFFRVLVTTFAGILGVNILFGIVGPASAPGPAYDALNYNIAKKRNIAEVITMRELTIHTTITLFMFLLFLVTSISFAILLGVVASFLLIPFSFQKKKI